MTTMNVQFSTALAGSGTTKRRVHCVWLEVEPHDGDFGQVHCVYVVDHQVAHHPVDCC